MYRNKPKNIKADFSSGSQSDPESEFCEVENLDIWRRSEYKDMSLYLAIVPEAWVKDDLLTFDREGTSRTSPREINR